MTTENNNANNDELTLALAIKHATEALLTLMQIRMSASLPEDHVKSVDAVITTVATRMCVEFATKMQGTQSNAVH